ncbi:MAG TPA: PEP-CTERM sorting domain-containing protein [Phenylobacterium sp.]|jgi:hypothetical protein
MKFGFAGRLSLAAGCAAALAAVAPSVAQADVHWVVNGAFDDGGSVSGFFDINVYGFLDGFDLTTTNGSTESGFEYTPLNSYYSNGTFYVDAEPLYQSDLHLAFLDDLSVPSAGNPILGGSPGPSWECQGSFSCYIPEDGAIRYISSGSATALVPEPASWALMLAGFVGLGAGLRLARRRGRLTLAAA